ncbi:MAG: DUF2069 domain-containing protein [Halieaceae bacterium]
MSAQRLPARARRTAISRHIALLSLALLLGVQLLDSWLRQPPLTIWVLRVLPLLIFLPGLVQDRPRTYIWICFVILMYFLILVLRLFAAPTDPVAWVGMISVVSLFVAAMMYARWRSQEFNRAL